MDKWLEGVIVDLSTRKFTGSVTLNFFCGGVGNVNVSESLKNPAIKNVGSTKIIVREVSRSTEISN